MVMIDFSAVAKHPLTTQQAADRLGVSRARVLQLIAAGRLPAEKFGAQHLIRPESLRLVRERKPGRPKIAKRNKSDS